MLTALRNWVPWKLVYEQEGILCRWLYTGIERFCDPFFDLTIKRYQNEAENSRGYHSVSTLEMAAEPAADIDSIYPTAFIFHVSRCGSTLLSQALGASRHNISVSEVPVFDEVLRLQLKGYAVSDPLVEATFKGVVSFYGQRKTSAERRYFIKTDCWRLLFHDRIRAAYSGVPFVIVYRHPSGVLESNRRHIGMQGVFGLIEPALYGFGPGMAAIHSFRDAYMVHVLEKFYTAIIDIAGKDNNILLLNYDQGFTAMMASLLDFVSFSPSPAELDAMAERGQYDAKSAQKKFVEQNTGGNQAEHQHLLDLYHEIDLIRTGTGR